MYPLLSEGFKERCFVYRYGRHLGVELVMGIGNWWAQRLWRYLTRGGQVGDWQSDSHLGQDESKTKVMQRRFTKVHNNILSPTGMLGEAR